jgi:Flp pilus assembly secretin CpaC
MNVTRMWAWVAVVFVICWMSACTVPADEPSATRLPSASAAVAAHPGAEAAGQPQILLNVRLIEWDTDKELAALERLFEKTDKVASLGERTAGLRVINLEGRNAVDDLLNQLRQSGQVRVLAEPTMVTLSGQKASLHSGGEIAMPAPDGSDEQPRKVEFGTQLEALPVLQPDGTLRLEVRLSVRELDPAHVLTVHGKPVPGLRSRVCSTAVDMKPGRTLVLSGVMRQAAAATPAQQPSTKVTLMTIHAEVVGNTAESSGKPLVR